MKITQEKLRQIIETHGKWLLGEDGGERAYLRGADLRGAYLRGADLRGAYLRGADLRGADLRGADLRGADLQEAYLQRAYLQEAYLQGAYLQEAYLQRAYLQRAYLQRAYLRGADLRGADLQGAYLPKGIYQVVGCGSYNRYTTYDSINNRVICGCWDDNDGNTLESFAKRVEAIYGEQGKEPNKQYYVEYMAAITFFRGVSGNEEKS